MPGSESCTRCEQDLTQLDRPAPNNRVERTLMEDQVGSLRPGRPITLPETATVGDAIAVMLEHDIGAVLLLDGQGKLAGIFSERDLLTKIAGVHEEYAGLPVREFMTPNPETVASHDTLAFALHKMDVGGYRHMPVVTEGSPTGVLSVRDMLRLLTKACQSL
jgi:CBS domain-containing protein